MRPPSTCRGVRQIAVYCTVLYYNHDDHSYLRAVVVNVHGLKLNVQRLDSGKNAKRRVCNVTVMQTYRTMSRQTEE